VLTLASQPALRRELSLRARAFAEANFDRDAVLARFEQDLEACIGVPAMKRAGEARL
jgi:colanic acid biosynthesis glycosyl transferase WcaI